MHYYKGQARYGRSYPGSSCFATHELVQHPRHISVHSRQLAYTWPSFVSMLREAKARLRRVAPPEGASSMKGNGKRRKRATAGQAEVASTQWIVQECGNLKGLRDVVLQVQSVGAPGCQVSVEINGESNRLQPHAGAHQRGVVSSFEHRFRIAVLEDDLPADAAQHIANSTKSSHDLSSSKSDSVLRGFSTGGKANASRVEERAPDLPGVFLPDGCKDRVPSVAESAPDSSRLPSPDGVKDSSPDVAPRELDLLGRLLSDGGKECSLAVEEGAPGLMCHALPDHSGDSAPTVEERAAELLGFLLSEGGNERAPIVQKDRDDGKPVDGMPSLNENRQQMSSERHEPAAFSAKIILESFELSAKTAQVLVMPEIQIQEVSDTSVVLMLSSLTGDRFELFIYPCVYNEKGSMESMQKGFTTRPEKEKTIWDQPDHVILGVDLEATEKEITKAWKLQSLQFHPDKEHDLSKKEVAEERMKRLNIAKQNMLKLASPHRPRSPSPEPDDLKFNQNEQCIVDDEEVRFPDEEGQFSGEDEEEDAYDLEQILYFSRFVAPDAGDVPVPTTLSQNNRLRCSLEVYAPRPPYLRVIARDYTMLRVMAINVPVGCAVLVQRLEDNEWVNATPIKRSTTTRMSFTLDGLEENKAYGLRLRTVMEIEPLRISFARFDTQSESRVAE